MAKIDSPILRHIVRRIDHAGCTANARPLVVEVMEFLHVAVDTWITSEYRIGDGPFRCGAREGESAKYEQF